MLWNVKKHMEISINFENYNSRIKLMYSVYAGLQSCKHSVSSVRSIVAKYATPYSYYLRGNFSVAGSKIYFMRNLACSLKRTLHAENDKFLFFDLK